MAKKIVKKNKKPVKKEPKIKDKKSPKPKKAKKDLNKRQRGLISDIVISIAGIGSEGIVELLYGKENVNEFLIAKKLNVTINQARNILYKLAEEGLVSFIRKKDKKNGGWYTYFWTLNTGKSLESLKKRINNAIDNLEHLASSKRTKQFYYCPNCDLEMSEENALLHDFTCPECGEVFKVKDNTEHITEIEEKINVLTEKKKIVDEELGFIEAKLEASKERKRKIEEKKKKAEREERRRLREKEKKKLAKKIGKKKVVKRKIKKTKKPKKKVKPVKRKVKKVRRVIKKAKVKKKIAKKPNKKTSKKPAKKKVRKKK